MNHDELAWAVVLRLREYRRRVDELLDLLEGKRVLSRDERQDLQAILTSLKADLKSDLKSGRVSSGPGTPNEIELSFFARTLQKAVANLRVAVNSHPIHSDWFSCLSEVRCDIDLSLDQLEGKYPAIK